MLATFARILQTILLPALAHGPCDFEVSDAKAFAVCRVRFAQHELRLVLHDSSGSRYSTLHRAKNAFPDAVFLGNAGMYHASGEPVGLFVDGGKTQVPLNLGTGYGNFFMKPNGVFWVDRSGFRVDESHDFSRKKVRAVLATQSGPLLSHDGVRHSAFRRGSQHQKIRNGVGVSVDGQTAFFVISLMPVNFWELTDLFQSRLGVKDALYLDGVVSSVLAPGIKRQGTSALGPIFVVRKR